jgi:hypothetical protein
VQQKLLVAALDEPAGEQELYELRRRGMAVLCSLAPTLLFQCWGLQPVQQQQLAAAIACMKKTKATTGVRVQTKTV